mmetsp:Transcript_14315/g.15940  ORF Transcript_14315/g.15940 Transcript_14315/m.15940 type:complete len:118 (-) Transcript_14315:137-490(-)|eukprot:CAMPEP_0194137512 /NCGR_PEP_ID=MMETSP0152-20130528/7405_1 /TAXON_ID=1049557 /ORGANISM="Thalassiothrix antarctica, Strain L6-D1" /LENGTH=117 /DNA_ID=CAMNT_0038834567 /DNA_START=174 /DNA_END=527 /DNA_ORIENTATION=-
MVLGKSGMRLEGLKFSVYIMIPVVSSIFFNDPENQRYWADYFQYLKYPASPNTNLKEEFEELTRKRELQKHQRKEYLDQLKQLQESAQRSRKDRAAAISDEKERNRWWFWQKKDSTL